MSEGSPPAESPGLTAERRREIERFFVRRGVPQLIDGYATEARMDANAAPLIAIWMIAGAVLFWGTRPDWHPAMNAAGIVVTLAFIAIGYLVIGWLRGRRPGRLPPKFDLIDVAAFGLLPGAAAGAIDWSAREIVVAGLNALLGIGLIYVIIGFGVLEIGSWALGRLGAQLVAMVGLVARTLPLLLILVVFLLFASEIWQVAADLSFVEVAALVGLLGVIAGLLVVTTSRAELHRLEARRDLNGVWQEALRTPAAPLLRSAPEELPAARALTWLERGNLLVLMLVSQLLQSAFVAIVVIGFLVVFGLLALPASIQEAWMGQPVRPLAELNLLGEVRTLSAELVTVSALLGGIVGLYFTGLAVADSAYRSEHFGRVVAEVSELLSARVFYLDAVGADPSPVAAGVKRTA